MYHENHRRLIFVLITRKKIQLVCDDRGENSFQKLKQCLFISTVLVLPGGNENLAIYSVASREGLKRVLRQNDEIIAYGLRRIILFMTLKGQLVSLRYREGKYYLYGTTFEVLTDHRSSTYLFA